VPSRSTLPATVVRFYGNVDYALDTIAHQQIIYIHASRLNDPFDPNFFVETDFDGSYEQLLAWVQKKHPDDLKWFIKHVTADSLGKSVDDVQTRMKNLRDTSFVFSCSAVTRDSHPKDNLYMWATTATVIVGSRWSLTAGRSLPSLQKSTTSRLRAHGSASSTRPSSLR
jgi:hypothetical protein